MLHAITLTSEVYISAVGKKNRLLKIVVPIIVCMMLLTCIVLTWICKHRGR
jgi:hypothetical protein